MVFCSKGVQRNCRFSRKGSVHITSLRASYRGDDKSLAKPTSRCILFDGENISFDARLVLYIYI